MSIIFEMDAGIRARYTPMNRAHIPGFPNKILKVDWLMYLPSLRDEKDDNAAMHLIKFHRHIHRLGLKFPEDCLMKMFMASLDDDAKLWYEGIPTSIIYSLKYFHIIFFNNYKQHHPALLLIESFCGKFGDLFQFMGIDINDPDIMIDEIEEALFELPLHYNGRLAVSCEEEEVFKSTYFPPLTKINENIQFDVCSPDIEDNMQEATQNLFQEQSGEEQVFETSCLDMVKEEQTLGLELHEVIGTIPIVFQEEIIEDMCYHDQQTFQQEEPFFMTADSPLTEGEIYLLLNINSQVFSSKFDDDLQQPC